MSRELRNTGHRRWYLTALLVVLVAVTVLVAVAGVFFPGRPMVGPALRWLTRTPEPLLTALRVLELNPDRGLISGWVEADRNSVDPEQASEIALHALQVLAGPDYVYGPQRSEEVDGEAVVEFLVAAPDCLYRSRVRMVDIGESRRAFLVCSAEIRAPAALAERAGRLEAALNTLGKDSRRHEPVYSTVFASLPRVLDQAEQLNAVEQIMARLRAAQVHEFSGETMYSMLSHSRLLDQGVAVAGRSVNFSIVLRPDPANECTWVVVGTPLCAGDY